jgi:hypothetical protein
MDATKKTSCACAKRIDAENELYQFMVLKPLELVADLVRGEHYQAAGVALEKLHVVASEFSLRLAKLGESSDPAAEDAPSLPV